MSFILRTWRCLNGRCAGQFDSGEPNPECPQCGCVRVEWVPNGGHIGGVAKAADAELRALADIFKMGDMNSAERGRGAKKVSAPPPSDPHAPVTTFGGGFSARIDPARGAQCVPTANAINFKVGSPIGSALPASKQYPSIAANTAVEASHRPANVRSQ